MKVMSPKQRSGLLQACIDAIVGAAVTVAIPVRASIDVGSKLFVRVDKHLLVVIPVDAVLGALGLWILTITFWPAGRGMVRRLASVVLVRKP